MVCFGGQITPIYAHKLLEWNRPRCVWNQHYYIWSINLKPKRMQQFSVQLTDLPVTVVWKTRPAHYMATASWKACGAVFNFLQSENYVRSDLKSLPTTCIVHSNWLGQCARNLFFSGMGWLCIIGLRLVCTHTWVYKVLFTLFHGTMDHATDHSFYVVLFLLILTESALVWNKLGLQYLNMSYCPCTT